MCYFTAWKIYIFIICIIYFSAGSNGRTGSPVPGSELKRSLTPVGGTTSEPVLKKPRIDVSSPSLR